MSIPQENVTLYLVEYIVKKKIQGAKVGEDKANFEQRLTFEFPKTITQTSKMTQNISKTDVSHNQETSEHISKGSEISSLKDYGISKFISASFTKPKTW